MIRPKAMASQGLLPIVRLAAIVATGYCRAIAKRACRSTTTNAATGDAEPRWRSPSARVRWLDGGNSALAHRCVSSHQFRNRYRQLKAPRMARGRSSLWVSRADIVARMVGIACAMSPTLDIDVADLDITENDPVQPPCAQGKERNVAVNVSWHCMSRLCDGFRMPAHGEADHAHRGPVSESRQGRKAREVGHPAQRALWGFGGQVWRSEHRLMRPERRRARGQQRVTGRMGVVMVVAGGSWVLERC